MTDVDDPESSGGISTFDADESSDVAAERRRKVGGRRNPFARLALFLRQVAAELRKVIWPTRRDLVSYTWIVIVFCVIMAGFVALCDFLFGKGVLFVFG